MSNLHYFKRYRMERRLPDLPPRPDLPAYFQLIPWDLDILEAHAQVKYQCFRNEIDATVFPSLSSPWGCQELMQSISRRSGFCPLATWLLTGPEGPCGTVQGVRDAHGVGAIQNLGVLATQRGLGLGSLLLLQALYGFRASGLDRASLEVTAKNEAAVRLYRRLGFRCYKTVYRAVELVELPTPRNR